mgnify:CR=1 FL=1
MTVGGSYSDHVRSSELSDPDLNDMKDIVQKEWRRFSWERGDLIDSDPEERSEYYEMMMEADGYLFEGTGLFCCGKLITIENVEVKPK